MNKQSIAVILAAMALGLRKKGSKDAQPLIKNITENDLMSHYGISDLEENQYLHGSSGFEDIQRPIIKRNPKHAAVFSDEQELQTPDMGIYVTKHPEIALSYNEGKENRYISLIEADDSELMIDEDVIGPLAFKVGTLFGKLNTQEFEIMDLKFYDNPESPVFILLKLYKQVMDQYGHHKPKDVNYTLKTLEKLSDKMDSFDRYEGDDYEIYRLVMFLGKRINFIMSEKDKKILMKALRTGKLSVSDDDADVDTFMSLRSYEKSFFIPDPENRGIKPIKIFRIVD